MTDSIDILVSLLNFIHGKGPQYSGDPAVYQGDQRPKYDAFLAGGPHKELWLYQSCMSHGCGSHQSDPVWAGWASYMVDASGVRNRASKIAVLLSICHATRLANPGEYHYCSAVAVLQLQRLWRAVL